MSDPLLVARILTLLKKYLLPVRAHILLSKGLNSYHGVPFYHRAQAVPGPFILSGSGGRIRVPESKSLVKFSHPPENLFC